jgi:hypothetical protein
VRFIDHRKRLARGAIAAGAALLTLAIGSSPSQARVAQRTATPTINGYSTGVFHWSAVRKVDHYQFQLASDRRFHAPVLGGAGNF